MGSYTPELLRLCSSRDDSDWTVSAVGGKALALRNLARAGVLVPDSIVIPASELRRWLETPELVEMKRSLPSASNLLAVIASCKEYHSKVQELPAPADLTAHVTRSLRRLRGSRFAVRSSATGEDGSATSWAGQFDSFLDVPVDRVARKVVDCWASLVNPRSLFYGKAINANLGSMEMSVLVQKFIPAMASGVAFTKHPITNDRSVIYIEAVHGLCDKLVAGNVIPDEYLLLKRDGSLLRASGSQRGALAGGDREGHATPSPAGAIPHQQSVLGSGDLRTIFEVCKNVEDRFGEPQDIEFAIWRKRLYVLQSRPITT